jgi:hypothetical protein
MSETATPPAEDNKKAEKAARGAQPLLTPPMPSQPLLTPPAELVPSKPTAAARAPIAALTPLPREVTAARQVASRLGKSVVNSLNNLVSLEAEIKSGLKLQASSDDAAKAFTLEAIDPIAMQSLADRISGLLDEFMPQQA